MASITAGYEEVADWLPKFAEWLTVASRRQDIPVSGSEDGKAYWEVFRASFVRHGVTKPIAHKAALRAMEENLFPDSLRAKVIAIARELLAETATASITQDGSLDAAKYATPEDCECGRHGLVSRFRHTAVGDGTGPNAPGFGFTCYCVCPVGRWLKAHHERDIRGRIPDLAETYSLQLHTVHWSDLPDNPHRYHPRQWDTYHARPIPPPDEYRADKHRLRYGLPRSPGPGELRRQQQAMDQPSGSGNASDGRINDPEKPAILPDRILDSRIATSDTIEYGSDREASESDESTQDPQGTE